MKAASLAASVAAAAVVATVVEDAGAVDRTSSHAERRADEVSERTGRLF
jgi:hypothetical protein